MTWTWIATNLLYINFCWYALLALAFALAGNHGKAVYFFGAMILTIGVIWM